MQNWKNSGKILSNGAGTIVVLYFYMTSAARQPRWHDCTLTIDCLQCSGVSDSAPGSLHRRSTQHVRQRTSQPCLKKLTCKKPNNHFPKKVKECLIVQSQ